jgi:hypothetical protein
MEQADELFLLIKALSKSEKKFFTQYVNIYEKGSSPIYLRLFDFLNEETTYDEEKIFKKFRHKNFRKNYPVTKHYLKNLILKTLRHSDLTVREERDLTVYVLDIKRVMAKGLFGMAKKMIEKLKDEAANDEKFYDIVHLIGMQRSLISMGYYRHEPAVTLDALDEEEEILLEKITTLRKVMNAAIQAYSLMHYEQLNIPESVLKEIQQISKRPVLQHYETLTSAKARHAYLQFWLYYYNVSGDFKKYAEYANKKFEFVKHEKLPLSAAVNWQVLACNHCMSAGLMLRDFSDYQKHFEFLEKLKLQSTFHESERFQTLSIFGLIYYTRHFDAERLDHYISFSKEGIKNLSPFLRKFFTYTLRCALAYACLKQKKLDDCWQEVNELTSLTNGETRKDYIGHVKIINLMLRFEMKEYNYVSYLLKNTYRFFMNYLYTSPVHKFMISYLKEALKTKDESRLASLNRNYLDILQRLKYQPNEAEMALVMMAEDFLHQKANA